MFSRSLVLTIAIAALVVSVLPANPVEDAPLQAPEEIRALRVERRDVLKRRAVMLEEAYARGQISVSIVVGCQNDFLEAELELADTKDQRVKLRTEMLENLKKAERFVDINVAQGVTPVHEQLEARAARLAAEIALKREQHNL